MKGLRKSEIKGVGVGAAGQVDPKTGTVIFAPNLGWKNVPLGNILRESLSLPVEVTNDVRAATLAEFKFGAGKGLDNFVNVFIGTGIGSGLVLNGKLLSGETNSAGEIGHICLDLEGPLCGCGKHGCFEAFSSGKGLENQVKSQLRLGKKSLISKLVDGDIEKVTGPVIGEAAKSGDKLALEALKRVGKYLGLAFANIHTFLNPQIILLGGGVMALKNFFIEDMEKSLKIHVLPVANRKKLFALAKYENDAVMVGGSAIFS